MSIFKRWQRFLSVLTVVAVFCITTAYTYAQNAAYTADDAPYIIPQNPNGKKILFDNTHAQTAGAADWVIDGAFSDYADGLAEEGYYVKELRKDVPIILEDMEDYDVFVIPEANIPYKVSEQAALMQYVENGGSIFFISDHYNADRNKNRWDASEVFNGYRRGAYDDPALGMNEEERNSEAMQGVESSDWLGENFGVRFRYNALGDIAATYVIPANETFGITENVESIAMHAGSTIAILNPEIAKGIIYLPNGLTESDKWPYSVDEGVYNGGGIEEGAYAAIAKKGMGKAAFLGDSSAVEDATPKYLREEGGSRKTTYDGYLEDDDATFLIQLTNWLAEQEDYKEFTEMDITLSEKTQLHDFETPELSTEPEEEPWANPMDGYLWYDKSTYAAGSYGSGQNPPSFPKFSIHMPEEIIAGQEQIMTIRAENMNAGEVLEGISAGIYLSGGTQVAKVQNPDGSWPLGEGYSQQFTMTADINGIAVIEKRFIIKEGIIGTANLRLRQSGTNVITNAITIGEEIKEPEIPENPEYSFDLPAFVQAGNELEMTVKFRGLEPNTTYTGFTIGAYLDGGTQIGKFKEIGVGWPSGYGYSTAFSITTDENGAADKTMDFILKDGSAGTYNLRLRLNGTNIITEKHQITGSIPDIRNTFLPKAA